MPTRTRAAPSLISRWTRSAPGKAALLAAALLDRPDQAGLDGRGGGVDVVAVEAKARFEPQRIARAEADGLHLRIGEQACARASAASVGRGRRSRSRPRPYSRSGRRGTRCRRSARRADIMKGMSAASGASFASTAAADGPCRAISARSSLRFRRHALRQARLRYGRSRRPSWRRSRRDRASPRGRVRRRGVTMRSSRMPPSSARSCE